MICPDSDLDCDNPGCRRGGCQGRRPNLPLFRAPAAGAAKTLIPLDAAMASRTGAAAVVDRAGESMRQRRFVAA
jgi:hypothetical protein